MDAAEMIVIAKKIAENAAVDFLELWYQSWKEDATLAVMNPLSASDTSQLRICLRIRTNYALIELIMNRWSIPEGLILVDDGNGRIVFQHTASP